MTKSRPGTTAPMTADRFGDLLGSGWLRESEGRGRYTWTHPVRHRRGDHVYCHAAFHPKTACFTYGLEHDCELIAVTRSLMGEPWRAWHEQLVKRHAGLRGPRTCWSIGQLYGYWSYCTPAMAEAVVVPTIATIVDVARLAVRQIAEDRDAWSTPDPRATVSGTRPATGDV